MNYLKYIAKTNRINQHPQGELGTRFLVNNIPKHNNPIRVLEIGCGTGHLAAILSNKSQLTYEGVDNLPEMINAAEKRKKQLNLNNCSFTLITSNELPFKNNSFDIIICESVLAIQKNENLNKILSESNRTLNENGLFLFNETIWDENSSISVRNGINKKSFQYNNLILADQEATLKNWRLKLKNFGFNIDTISEINNLNKSEVLNYTNNLENLSIKFTKRQILKSFFNPRFIFLYWFFKLKNNKIKIQEDLLKSYLFVCSKI